MSRFTAARAVMLAALAAGAAALAGCGKTGELQRPAPLFGRAPSAAPAPGSQPGQDATRPVETIDPRDMINNPGPSRTVQIPGMAPNPTAVAPQGALPDPYANPR
jgi:hypothetical protein